MLDVGLAGVDINDVAVVATSLLIWLKFHGRVLSLTAVAGFNPVEI